MLKFSMFSVMRGRFARGAALFVAGVLCALLAFWLFFSKEDYSRYRTPHGWSFPPGTSQSVIDGAEEWERKQRGLVDDSLRREFLLKRSREDSAKRASDSLEHDRKLRNDPKYADSVYEERAKQFRQTMSPGEKELIEKLTRKRGR